MSTECRYVNISDPVWASVASSHEWQIHKRGEKHQSINQSIDYPWFIFEHLLTTSHHNVSSQCLITKSHHKVSSPSLITKSHHKVSSQSPHNVSSQSLLTKPPTKASQSPHNVSSQRLLTKSPHKVFAKSPHNVFFQSPHEISSQSLLTNLVSLFIYCFLYHSRIFHS